MADNGFKVNKSINLNPQSAAPANPVDGDIYYDSTIGSFVQYHLGAWTSVASIGTLAATANMTSAQFTPSLVQNSIIKLTGTTAGSIYGMTASSTAKQLIVFNGTNQTQVLKYNNTFEPTSNNRILTPTGGDMNLPAGEVVQFVYDATVNKWQLVSVGSGAGASVVATTSNNGIVTLHAASATPSTPTVLTDGDFNVANGVVGLDANKAATISVSGGNETGLTVTGNGAGQGINATGGSTGNGVTGTAGVSATYGAGVTGIGQNFGAGVVGSSNNTSPPGTPPAPAQHAGGAFYSNGVGSNGVYGQGSTTGAGVYGLGGNSNGSGVYGIGTSSGTGGIGVEGHGVGFFEGGYFVGGSSAGGGIQATGGTNGIGAFIQAGSGNADGLQVTGSGTGNGVTSTAGGTSGAGISATGGGTGAGILAGGGSNGPGGYIHAGGGNNYGLFASGTGTGKGCIGQGGATSSSTGDGGDFAGGAATGTGNTLGANGVTCQGGAGQPGSAGNDLNAGGGGDGGHFTAGNGGDASATVGFPHLNQGGQGGIGLIATGGNAGTTHDNSLEGGPYVYPDEGGAGAVITGGTGSAGGTGLEVTGGACPSSLSSQAPFQQGGHAVIATGGNGGTSGGPYQGGDGVQAVGGGGGSGQYGNGVMAVGGGSSIPGINTYNGNGLVAIGGAGGVGAITTGGATEVGLQANPGSGNTVAIESNGYIHITGGALPINGGVGNFPSNNPNHTNVIASNSIVKSWGKVQVGNNIGATPVAAYNLQNSNANGVGVEFGFAVGMQDNDYVIVATPHVDSGGPLFHVTATSTNTGQFTLWIWNAAGSIVNLWTSGTRYTVSFVVLARQS